MASGAEGREHIAEGRPLPESSSMAAPSASVPTASAPEHVLSEVPMRPPIASAGPPRQQPQPPSQPPSQPPPPPAPQPASGGEAASFNVQSVGSAFQPSCKLPKEASTVETPAMPTPTGFRHWRTGAREAIAAAAVDPQPAFTWTKEVEERSITFESLADSKGRVTLDIKLAAGLIKHCDR